MFSLVQPKMCPESEISGNQMCPESEIFDSVSTPSSTECAPTPLRLRNILKFWTLTPA